MAANPMKGEAELGDAKIVVTFNSLCSLEAAMGRDVPTIITMMASGIGFGFAQLRTAVRVLLDREISESEAGELIAKCGRVDIEVRTSEGSEPEIVKEWAAAVQIAKAFEGFFADRKDDQADPRKAA